MWRISGVVDWPWNPCVRTQPPQWLRGVACGSTWMIHTHAHGRYGSPPGPAEDFWYKNREKFGNNDFTHFPLILDPSLSNQLCKQQIKFKNKACLCWTLLKMHFIFMVDPFFKSSFTWIFFRWMLLQYIIWKWGICHGPKLSCFIHSHKLLDYAIHPFSSSEFHLQSFARKAFCAPKYQKRIGNDEEISNNLVISHVSEMLWFFTKIMMLP